MQRIKYGDTYAMRVKVKRVIKGEEVDFDLSKCKGMSAELIGAVKRYPLTIAASGNIITADIDTSIFPEPDTDEGTAFALSVKGYEKGQLWRILQNRFLVVMPADWSPSSGSGDCDCEEALAEIRTKNTEQDGDITACEKKNEEQDKRLDEIEEVDKRQDKRLNTLRVLPFDGQTPAADGASGLYFDEAQGKFVAVNATDAFAAKGCKETDYNDAKTAKAIETQLYLCGAKLYKIEGGVMSEYAPAAAASTPVFKVIKDTGEYLTALPTATTDKSSKDADAFVSYATEENVLSDGTLFLCVYNATTKAYDKYITWADADEYGALDSYGARVPRSDAFFVNMDSGVIMRWHTGLLQMVALSGGTEALEKIAQFQHLTDNLGVYPFDGTLPAADDARGVFFDAENGCFTAVGSYADDYDNYFHKGFASTDYNGSDGKAIEGRLFRCGSVLYQVKDGKLQEYCAEEKEEIETLRKRSDTLRILPFDGEMTDTDTDVSGLMFNMTSKNFVTMGADDAFTAKGYKETDYNETDEDGNVSPIAANLYVCGSTLYKVEDGTLVEYGGGADETLRKRVEGIKILPVDGVIESGEATAESGVLFDWDNKKFVSKGDTDAFAAHGYSESDYNSTDSEGNVTPIAANLYAMTNADFAAQFGTLWAITSETLTWQKTEWEAGSLLPLHVEKETRVTACETKDTEQDDRLTALEKKTATRCSYVKLVSAAGGTVLVDGYEVDIPAGKMAVVFPDSSFKTNGTTCEYINVNHLNTEGWKSFEGMFENFAGKTLDLTALNWESVKKTTDMFKNCPMLYDLQLGKWWHPTSGAVLDFTGVPNWTVESLQTNLVTNSSSWGGGLRGTASVLLDINAYDHLTDDDLQTLTRKGYIVQSLDGTDENRTENLWWGDEIKDE